MQIFQTFGVNIYLLVAEIINFLIVLYVLKRFLYKPIFKMLKKRENIIQLGLTDAEKSKALLEQARKDETNIIKEANKKAEAILNNAKTEAFETKEAAGIQAKKQTQIMLDSAKEQIEQERKKAERLVFEKVNKIMKDFIEKSTEDLFNDKMQEVLVDNALKRFKREYK